MKINKTEETMKNILGWVFLAIIVWAIASSWGQPSGRGCHEDKYGNETCWEDPR